MLGFEITFNGESTHVALAQGVTTAIVTCLKQDGKKEVNLNLSGLDTVANKQVKWADTELKEGDELVLKVKDIDNISSPLSSKEANAKNKEQRLKDYYKLKESLEKEGLI